MGFGTEIDGELTGGGFDYFLLAGARFDGDLIFHTIYYTLFGGKTAFALVFFAGLCYNSAYI